MNEKLFTKWLMIFAISIILASIGVSTMTDAIIIKDAFNDTVSYWILFVLSYVLIITGTLLLVISIDKLYKCIKEITK